MTPAVTSSQLNLKTNPISRLDPPDKEARALPDLVIDSFEPTPNLPRVGDSVSYDVTIRNQGQASAGKFTVHLNGEELGSHTREVSRLQPDAQATLRFGPFQVKAGGIHSYLTEVDPNNQVAEADENNNFRVDWISIEDSSMPRPPLPAPPIPPIPPRPPKRASW